MSARSIDLWKLQVPVEQLHSHFRLLAESAPNRESINRWADGFIDIDGDFVPKFQRTFSPQFWELYLHAMFKSLGFGVSRPAVHPDFVLQTPQGTIVTEAKVTEAGPGQIPESTPKHEVPYEANAFYAQTTAKLSGAVKGKIESYRKYASEPHVKGRPFLLSLGAYDHPWFVVQHARAIWRVLYQYDQPTGYLSDTGNMIEKGHTRVQEFTTPRGAVVPIGYFLDPTNADVSAVLFNPRATVSKLFADPLRKHRANDRVFASWYMVSTGTFIPQDLHPSHYRETLADGGYLLINPFATHPIDPGPFFRKGTTVCTFDPVDRKMTSRTPEPFLFERTTVLETDPS